VALLAIGGGILLPAEHVHYAREGHHPAIVHRHFSEAPTSKAAHLGDDDDHARDLRELWLARRAFVFAQASALACSAWCHTPPPGPPGEFVASRILRIDHGPPLLPRVLRGPPLLA
jgi:hypothetical protein